MLNQSRLLFLLLLFVLCVLPNSSEVIAQSNGGAGAPQPPMADKKTKTTNIHGVTIVDDYFWLREKTNPAVMSHLKAEEAYTDTVMKPTAALQEKLYNEMLSHIKQTDENVPYRYGNYFYYSRTVEGKQYPIFCRKKGSTEAAEEILLDVNELAKGQQFMSVGDFIPSDDGNLLAYSTDNTGYRQYLLQIKDLRTGQLLPERIERVTSVAWANDNKTLFYVTEDAVTKRSDKFFRHVLGTDKNDLVYDEKDELFDMGVGRSLDKAVIFLHAFSKTSTEARFLRADDPNGTFKVILPREKEHEYDVDYRNNLLYIRTNKGAKNFRIVTAPLSDPSEKNWKEFVAHNPAVKIEGISLFANHGVLSEWENGLQQLEVIDFKTNKRQRIKFPEPVYSVFVSSNREFDTNVVRYSYNSLVTPNSVFDYDMNTGKSTLLKETEVPGGFDRNNYKSERVFATASDGTKIPMSMVYRKGVKLDGSAPLLLYGYGSYGYSIPPTFSSTRLSLLDRGVIFVIGHIRGGGETWRGMAPGRQDDEQDEYVH